MYYVFAFDTFFLRRLGYLVSLPIFYVIMHFSCQCYMKKVCLMMYLVNDIYLIYNHIPPLKQYDHKHMCYIGIMLHEDHVPIVKQLSSRLAMCCGPIKEFARFRHLSGFGYLNRSSSPRVAHAYIYSSDECICVFVSIYVCIMFLKNNHAKSDYSSN